MPRSGTLVVNHIPNMPEFLSYLALTQFCRVNMAKFVRLPYLNCCDNQDFISSSVFQMVLFSLEIFSHCKSNKDIFEKRQCERKYYKRQS